MSDVRTDVGYYRGPYSQMLLSAAVAQGSTDTSVISWPTITIDGDAVATNDYFTATTTAGAGTQITLDQPGDYAIELYCALAGAGVLTGGISLGGTSAPFNVAPDDFGTAAAGFISIGGQPTLATAHVLISLSAYVNLARTDIDGAANVLRFAATVGVTLDAANSRARVRYLGRREGY